MALENAVSAAERQDQRFGPYRLQGPNGPLRRDDNQVVALPPKPLAMLWTLVRSAGEVVTKDQLLAAVWPDVVVTEGVISACLRDLRRALGDDPKHPRYIATAHRIGYRFMAEVTSDPQPLLDSGPATASAALRFVGRQSELGRLHAAWAKAARGQRQLVFVTGEAGIGKTELVDVFVAQVSGGLSTPGVDKEERSNRGGLRLARGQCVELYGAGEPFLPLLEALGRLCREAGGGHFVTLLRRHAPTWLAQLPGLLDEDDFLALGRSLAGNTQDRMLREIMGALEAAATKPLVLVLEDMHWSDRSSVDWLSMLVRRRENARLLVIVTCRPVELIVSGHPLKAVKQGLVSRGAAVEILLGYLTASAVQAYVSQLVPGDTAQIAATIHRRSQGHPLFMVRLVESLVLPATDGLSGGAAAEVDAADAVSGEPPNSVRELIEAQLSQLDPRQRATLDAASVVGLEFTATSVAAGLLCVPEEAERRLEELDRLQLFVEGRGLVQAHDGKLTGCFGFRHDLYRETLYHCLGAARKARLHGRIAERLARTRSPRSVEFASELAVHFERARNPLEAARYCRQAGEAALRRGAWGIALAHVDKGLSLLAAHPSEGEAERVELPLRLTQGSALLATQGFGGRAVESTYVRAHELSKKLDDRDALAPVLAGLWNLYITRAAFAPALEVASQLYLLAGSRPDPVLSMLAHNVRAQAHLFTGAPAAAIEHVEPCLEIYEFARHRQLAMEYGEDPAVVCHHCAVLTHLLLDDRGSALSHLAQGLELARRLEHLFSEAQMLWVEAVVWRELGETARLHEVTHRLIALCRDNDFALWRAGGQMLHAVALGDLGHVDKAMAIALEGMETWRNSRTELFLPYSLALLAEVYEKAGKVDEARQLIEEALQLATQSGERWYEPELHRVRGELCLRGEPATSAARTGARSCFERAVDLSQRQQARLFELRAGASLSGLLENEGKRQHTLAGL
jgi:DNA-binding winged helix-turn-helix (wHTH) protein/tetratricopeptide (TPR) repeat protein